MNKQTITLITGNDAKVQYVKRWTGFPVERQKLDLAEIQSLDPEEVVLDKARRAYAALERPVLVEDVSLVFGAYHDRLPGPFIKWYLETLTLEEICRLLDPFADRSAIASVRFAFSDGWRQVVSIGRRHGLITEGPRGDRDFGFSPIFQPEGWDKTWGEMDEEEKEQCSMRKIALQDLRARL